MLESLSFNDFSAFLKLSISFGFSCNSKNRGLLLGLCCLAIFLPDSEKFDPALKEAVPALFMDCLLFASFDLSL